MRRRSAKSDILEYADETTMMDFKHQDVEKTDKPSKPALPLPAPAKQISPAMDTSKEAPMPSVTPPQQPVRTKPRLSFKTASQATLSFLSARRKVEAGLKNWNHKKKASTGLGSKKSSPEEQAEGRSDAKGLSA